MAALLSGFAFAVLGGGLVLWEEKFGVGIPDWLTAPGATSSLFYTVGSLPFQMIVIGILYFFMGFAAGGILAGVVIARTDEKP